MAIEDITINWLARYAGIDDCFVQDGVSYNNVNGSPQIGSTADVLNEFYLAHRAGKDNAIIILGTTYSQIYIINKNQDITREDVKYVYTIENYCYIDCLEITCPNICKEYELWSQKCENDLCIIDELIESNSSICGYDPCEGVVCENVCIGKDLWSKKCINGTCVVDQLIESNSSSCQDLCAGVTCENICDGLDLWSQTCDPDTGNCVPDQLIEENSATCEYDPCEGVVCDDVCIFERWSQSCDIGTGECVQGQLIEHELIDCNIPNQVTSNDSSNNTALIIGGISAVGLGMLLLIKSK